MFKGFSENMDLRADHPLVVEFKDLVNGKIFSRKEEIECFLQENPDLKAGLLTEVTLIGANLSGVNLRGIDLAGSNLLHADLSSTDLSYANMTKTMLSGANLRGAKLCGANLSNANLISCDLSIADCSDVCFLNANLWGAKFHKANLKDVNLNGAFLSGISFLEVRNFCLSNQIQAFLNGASFDQEIERVLIASMVVPRLKVESSMDYIRRLVGVVSSSIRNEDLN